MELEFGQDARLPISSLYPREAYLDTSEALGHFIAQHAFRFSEVLSRLSPTHRNIVEALPYLFHHNAPSLPGWCPEAPFGIDGYSPTRSQLSATKAVAPAARTREVPNSTEIEAIYIMGSAGSLAQTRASDIDIWVCLPEARHAPLAKKLTQLETWAQSMGLELQMFLVDPHRFRDAEPTDTGYTPLLLDEFYRSGCHLAGRYPMWWLTPQNCSTVAYYETVNLLHDRRIIDSRAFHDFGPVGKLSNEAIIAAVLIQFEQSLITPYKSLLKLGLLESYFQGAPLLSDQYKTAVLEDHDVTRQDVYTLLIEHLERHFSNDVERLRFFRTAWLTKSVRGNSRLNRNPIWRTRAREWGFDNADIERLRWPGKWTLSSLLNEQSLFAGAYEAISAFIRDLLATNTTPTKRDLLARCINTLNEAIALAERRGPIHPPPVSNYHGTAKVVRTDSGWVLQDDGVTIQQASSRTGLLYWMKVKELPIETLVEHNERWITQLWPLLGTHRLLVVNAEPEPDSDPDRGSEDIWSTDLVDGRSETKLLFGDAIAEMLDTSGAPKKETSITCVNTIRATAIESHLHTLLCSAKDALTNEEGIFLSSISDKPVAWIKHMGRVVYREYRDNEALITDLPCSRHIHGSGDDDLWLEILRGPSLFVSAKGHHGDLTYRDEAHKYQIAAPHRPLVHFYHSIQLFVGILARRGVATPKVYANAVTTPNPDYAALGFKLIFRHRGDGWQITSGRLEISAPTLTKSLIRRVRASVLKYRKASGDYPIYLTDLELPNEDFHTHLYTKLRIERMLTRAPQLQ